MIAESISEYHSKFEASKGNLITSGEQLTQWLRSSGIAGALDSNALQDFASSVVFKPDGKLQGMSLVPLVNRLSFKQMESLLQQFGIGWGLFQCWQNSVWESSSGGTLGRCVSQQDHICCS